MGQASHQNLRLAGTISQSQAALTLGEAVSLRTGRIHEVTGPGADMFVLLAAAEHARATFWIGLHRDLSSLCPTGFQAYMDVADMVLVEAVSRGELLWAADQALRADGCFCVILEMPDTLSLKESRRLQLAAEQGGALGLILLRGGVATSAAQTRWKCAPLVSGIGIEHPVWSWSCDKGKNGEAGSWRVTCQGRQNAKDTLHLAATASA